MASRGTPFFLIMVVFPPCKINLGLNILSKRSDGYHNISTCFYPVAWTDILEIIPSNDFSFTFSGNVVPGNASDNLCVKAYALLKEDHQLPPVNIHLHKVIPTGAGLGGGSSDAAFTLRLLRQMFNLDITDDGLSGYAARLGSDCAFFLKDKPMMGQGRGEQLEEIDFSLKGKYLLIVKPSIHIPTADAYAGVRPSIPGNKIEDILQRPLTEWKNLLVNDFEQTVFVKFPLLSEIKESLYRLGAVYASMSGSGSSLFGIFEQAPTIPDSFLEYQTWQGALTV